MLFTLWQSSIRGFMRPLLDNFCSSYLTIPAAVNLQFLQELGDKFFSHYRPIPAAIENLAAKKHC
jgi:hypothetical protein